MLDPSRKPTVEPLEPLTFPKGFQVVYAVLLMVVLANDAPLHATEYSLISSGADAEVVFRQINPQTTSSNSVASAQGYTTTMNNVFTNGASAFFTQVLLLNNVRAIGGTGNREFALDINEMGSNPLSPSDVQVFLTYALFGAASTEQSQGMPALSFGIPQPRVGGFDRFVCANNSTGAPEICTGPISLTNVGGVVPSVPEPASIFLVGVGLAVLIRRFASRG